MQLDDLKDAWAAHGAMLARSIKIDQRLLREALLHKVRFALAPYILWRVLELVLAATMLIVVLSVVADHAAEPRYVLVGGILAGLTGAITAMVAHLLITSLTLDYGGSVVAIQRAVERIRLREYRALKWGVLGGVLGWLPAGLVLFEALTGVDALARADLSWLVANLAFGLVFLAVAQLMSRRYIERTDLGPRARRLVDAVSGRALRSADRHLAELATFEFEQSAV